MLMLPAFREQRCREGGREGGKTSTIDAKRADPEAVPMKSCGELASTAESRVWFPDNEEVGWSAAINAPRKPHTVYRRKGSSCSSKH